MHLFSVSFDLTVMFELLVSSDQVFVADIVLKVVSQCFFLLIVYLLLKLYLMLQYVQLC